MGQRANLIIVQHGKYELFYTHWAANTLTSDLFWSPEFATAFIQMQRKVDESGWLDDVWAEGGAVVDWDNRVFLLFGGEDILWDVLLRRMYLKLLSYVWTGWTIRWAYEGIADIAEYVNYPRSKVLSKPENKASNYQYDLAPPKEKSWTDVIGSVVYKDKSIGLFPLDSCIDYLLESGLQLVNKVEEQKQFALNELLLEEWIIKFPKGGFHLDLPSQTLEFWMSDRAPYFINYIRQSWSEWKITDHHDNFEFQEKKTKEILHFPKPDYQILKESLESILLREKGKSSVDGLLELSDRDRQAGKTVEINPWALRDDRLELNIARKKEILNQAFKEVANENIIE